MKKGGLFPDRIARIEIEYSETLLHLTEWSFFRFARFLPESEKLHLDDVSLLKLSKVAFGFLQDGHFFDTLHMSALSYRVPQKQYWDASDRDLSEDVELKLMEALDEYEPLSVALKDLAVNEQERDQIQVKLANFYLLRLRRLSDTQREANFWLAPDFRCDIHHLIPAALQGAEHILATFEADLLRLGRATRTLSDAADKPKHQEIAKGAREILTDSTAMARFLLAKERAECSQGQNDLLGAELGGSSSILRC